MKRIIGYVFAIFFAASWSSVADAEDVDRQLTVAAARHSALQVEDGLRWDSQFVLDVDAAFDFAGGTIDLAVPLPAGERLLPSPVVDALEKDGHIVGLRIGARGLVDRSIRASFFQPMAAIEGDTSLGAPIASSDAVQIVDGASGIELARGGVLEQRFRRHLGFTAPNAVSAGAREEARRLTGAAEHVDHPSVYVRGGDLRAIGDLRGHILTSPARSKSTAAAVGFVFFGIVGLLVFAARKLRHAAEVERADRALASEIDALEGGR